MENISIREWQIRYARGDFNNGDYKTMCRAGWYDWFCKDSSLKNRLDKMAKIIMKLETSDRIDIDKLGVWFKNNCPLSYLTYDDFRLYDLNTGDNEYVIDMMSEAVKSWYGNNYAIFHKSDFRNPIYTCRTSAEVVKWLNNCK